MASGSKSPRKATKDNGLTADDRRIWRIIAQTIRPLQQSLPDQKPAHPPSIPSPLPAVLPAIATARPKDQKLLDRSVDRRTKERFINGKMTLDARLDLHGMTGPVARHAVLAFIKSGYRAGNRCVLIITGKGAPQGGGILQQSLPHWLDDPEIAHMILAQSHARPKDGGNGAFYVLIRRKRD